MDDQVTRPSWKLRNPEARRVAHSIRLRLGTTGVFSLRSMSCLAACAETDAPSSRDRNAPAALMSANTAKARMSERGRRSANSLQNVLSQSMPYCCSISRPAAENASCKPANRGMRLGGAGTAAILSFRVPVKPSGVALKNRWVHEMAEPSDFLINFQPFRLRKFALRVRRANCRAKAQIRSACSPGEVELSDALACCFAPIQSGKPNSRSGRSRRQYWCATESARSCKSVRISRMSHSLSSGGEGPAREL
jgi:hypothetical protein